VDSRNEPPVPPDARPTLVRGLRTFDLLMIIVGGVIGSGIFLTPAVVAAELRTPWLFLGVWAAGAVITVLACLAFAELATMFPSAGGQYVYLREAFGEFPAFLYGWMIFVGGLTGGVAAVAVAFAEYLGAAMPYGAAEAVFTIFGRPVTRGQAMAVACIMLLTWANIIGLRRGASLLNAVALLKFAAMAVFVLFAFSLGSGSWENVAQSSPMPREGTALFAAIGVALIAVFWSYDGWTFVTWVAGESKTPQRSIPIALIAGMSLVGIVYLCMNLAYMYAMPLERMAEQLTVAQAAAEQLFSPRAGVWLSAMIALSCFGATSAAIMTGARVYYAMARDGVFFQRMGDVHAGYRTPAFSLAIQGVWSSALALSGTYDQLATYAVFVMVLSYIATVVGLFVLRRKRPDHPRPYRCTGYPYVPAIYIVIASAWALNAGMKRPWETLLGIGIVFLGVPGYLYWKRKPA
jgi:APA family basic amino acid/polyamine antiporter